jgi:hypothetical protein
MVRSPHREFQSVCNDAEHAGGCFRSKIRAKKIKTLQPEAENPERHVQFRKGSQRFPQMRLHDGVAGDASEFIHAAGALQAIFAMFAVFGLVCIFKALDGTDYRPMRVSHRHRPNVYENAVTFFVVDVAVGFGGVGALDRGSNRTFVAAGFALVLVALQKSSPRARPAYDLVTKIAGDALRAVAPENDFPLKVDNTDSYLQTLQHASTYLRILKGKHCLSLGAPDCVSIGTIHSNFTRIHRADHVRGWVRDLLSTR